MFYSNTLLTSVIISPARLSDMPTRCATANISAPVMSMPLPFTDVVCSQIPGVRVKSKTGETCQSPSSYKNAKFLE